MNYIFPLSRISVLIAISLAGFVIYCLAMFSDINSHLSIIIINIYIGFTALVSLSVPILFFYTITALSAMNQRQIIVTWANLFLLLFCVILAYAISYRMIGVFDGSVRKDGATVFDSPTCLYFSIVTWTTLGYGDISPRSGPARFLAAMEALSGYMAMAALIATLSESFKILNPSKTSH